MPDAVDQRAEHRELIRTMSPTLWVKLLARSVPVLAGCEHRAEHEQGLVGIPMMGPDELTYQFLRIA